MGLAHQNNLEMLEKAGKLQYVRMREALAVGCFLHMRVFKFPEEDEHR